MTWQDAQLSIPEMETALRKAGIDPEGFAHWTPADVERAETVLQATVRRRLEGKRHD